MGGAPHIDEVPDRRMYFQRTPAYEGRLIMVGLRNLEQIRAKRQAIMHIYREGLSDCEGIILPPDEPEADVVPIRYPVRLTNTGKGAFHRRMLREGCDLGFSFGYTCVPAADEKHYPGAITVARQVVNLPIYSRLGSDAALVVRAVRRALDVDTAESTGT